MPNMTGVNRRPPALPRAWAIVVNLFLAGTAFVGDAVALSWEAVPERRFTLTGEGFAVDGVDRVAYVFGGVGSPVPSGAPSHVYRLALDAPGLDWQLASSAGAPPGRVKSHLFFDRGRGKLLVVGGWPQATDPSNDVWSWDPINDTWAEVVTKHPGPDTLWSFQPLVHDVRRNRLLYVGGALISGSRQAWALDLSLPEPDWSLLETTNPPPLNYAATAAYDSLGDRVFVYGGVLPNDLGIFQLWQLDLATLEWTLALSQNPNAATTDGSKLFCHRETNRLYVHTPHVGGATLAWLPLDAPTAWSNPSVNGEAPFQPADVGWAYEPVAGELLVHEKFGNLSRLRTLHVGAFHGWTSRIRAGRPEPSSATRGAADATGRGWYVMGGTGLWRIDLDDPSTSEMLAPTGGGPGELRDQGVVWDSLANRILVYGGIDPVPNQRLDLWALELGPVPNWRLIETDQPGPPNRADGLALDDARRALYVHATDGGLWRLDLSVSPAAWTQVASGLPFSGRKAMAFDPVANRLVIVDPYRGYYVDFNVEPPLVSPAFGEDPSAPAQNATAWDSRRRQMLIHNGLGYVGNTFVYYRWRTDLFRATGDPVFLDPGVTNATSTPAGYSLGVYDPVRDRMLILDGRRVRTDYLYHYEEPFPGIWTLQFDQTTPARMDLVEAAAEAGGIWVRFAGVGWTGDVEVERTEAAIEAWERVGTAVEIAPGTVEFVDHSAVAGMAYRYRGRFFDETGERVTSPSAEVTLAGDPPRLALALRHGTIVRGTAIEFTLGFAVDGPAVLEVIDARGRRVARVELEGVAGEARQAKLEPRGGFPPGLYFARLLQGGESRRVRLVRL